jgi:type IV fimbrial biogenesis protein FimT
VKNQTRKKQSGFTLVELMICIAVATILCAISFPALGGLTHRSQSRAAQDAMLATLNLARSTAVTHQREIVVCPSSDHLTCDNDIWWQNGWIAFEDTNHDGDHDANEPLLQTSQSLNGIAMVTSADRKRLTYRGDGATPGSNLTFTFCDARGIDGAATIVVGNAGRPRQGAASHEEAALACGAVNR